jgi:NADPH-dependent 2,4-dienoyl-CoA reductase/sulfur reductase-like enzyme
VFDLAIAGTGLREDAARDAGYEPLPVASRTWDRNPYYPGATLIETRLLGDQRSGRLLGAQMLGHLHAQIPKRLDILATALHNDARIETLDDLDLTYTPPFGRPWDPIQDAAQAWKCLAQQQPT